MQQKPSTAYLALGSNLNNPVQQLLDCCQTLKQHPKIDFIQHSSFYQTPPLGPQDQQDFINAVVQIQTSLTPEQLLQTTQQIEKDQQRIKTRHWGPRTLDIDILLYEQLNYQSPNLSIPHKEMTKRNFVIIPLAEISPKLILPDGTSLTEILSKQDQNNIKKVALKK